MIDHEECRAACFVVKLLTVGRIKLHMPIQLSQLKWICIADASQHATPYMPDIYIKHTHTPPRLHPKTNTFEFASVACRHAKTKTKRLCTREMEKMIEHVSQEHSETGKGRLGSLFCLIQCKRRHYITSCIIATRNWSHRQSHEILHIQTLAGHPRCSFDKYDYNINVFSVSSVSSQLIFPCPLHWTESTDVSWMVWLDSARLVDVLWISHCYFPDICGLGHA